MALLYDAAVAWDKLLNTSYQFTYGLKKCLHEIHLSFQSDQFAHLSGIHHATDIDLKIPYNKTNFLSLILSGALDETAIEKSCHWKDIKGRLESLIRLEEILDSDFTLYLFKKEQLPFYSDIEAKFMLKNNLTGDIVFLFVDGPLSDSFCRSIFSMQNRDYTLGQRKLGVLKKVKFNHDNTEVLFDKIAPSSIDNKIG